MTAREPRAIWERRPCTAAQRRALAKLLPLDRLTRYLRNRNDRKWNLPAGQVAAIDAKRQIDAAALAAVDDLRAATADLKAVADHAAYTTSLWAGYGRERTAADAAQAVRAFAGRLDDMAVRAREIAAVLDIRAGDEEADEALRDFGRILREARDEAQNGEGTP